MIDTKQTRIATLQAKAGRYVKAFRKDEDGVMIAFSLLILVLMLIVGGMAVDFMRLEARRSHIQVTVDRAVLAAADLDQTLDPQAVVNDYLLKAGLGNLSANTTVKQDSNYRQVTTSVDLELNTFFLRLIDMDTLGVTSKSTAIEGVGNIEVSLVVDISGSMNEFLEDSDGNELTERRIDKLRTAANSFVEKLITEDTKDRVSLSFVPYTSHVSIGADIFDALNTNSSHDYSYCVDFPDADYKTTALNTAATYKQVPHYQWNIAFEEIVDANGNVEDGAKIPLVEEPICPMFDFEQIIPLSQNADTLTDAIDLLEPRGGTSIFMGLKWGVALLDPSMRTLLGNIDSIDAAFDGRPVNYALQDDPSPTVKYVVLMTDGQNGRNNRLRDSVYETPSQRAHWANMNIMYFNEFPLGYRNLSDYTYELYDADDADRYMQDICDAAKAPERGIIIYGIAMGATEHGEQEMAKCASSPAHYYQTSGAELEAIFEAIAEQITDLRLTQ